MTRLFGWLFALVAISAISYDVWEGPYQERELEFATIAERWSELHRASLIGLNSTIEKDLSPDIWDNYVLPALNWPAALTFTILAILFFFLASRTGRRQKVFSRNGRR